MRSEFQHTGGLYESSPCSDRRSRYEPMTWVLLVALLGCLSFWGAVVFGIVAAV
jgi:hypothetical protein